MRPPGNILYIIQGEMSILLTAMRRGPRWSGYSAQQDEGQDSLLKAFAELKVILSHTEHWEDLDPSTVITPFLNVIRDNDTPGPVTGLALGAVNKLLSYNIIDPSLESAPAVMESIADAVTHARFVGTETSSDEVVLVKILQVLRTLLMIPSGYLLSNESVCEIMQSCFRLCFEPRLSELLRRSAEHILTDLTQLLFTRLAEMSEDDQTSSLARKLKMRSGSLDGRGKKKGKFPRLKYRRRQGEGKDATGKEQGKDGAAVAGAVKKPDSLPVEPATSETQSEGAEQTSLEAGTPSDRTPLATTPGVPKGAVVDLNHLDRVHVPETVRETPEEGPPVVPSTESTGEIPAEDGESVTEGQRSGGDGAAENREPDESQPSTEQPQAAANVGPEGPAESTEPLSTDGEAPSDAVSISGASAEPPPDETEDELRENPQGVKFTGRGRGSGPLVPYGLPCVREVLNFFASLTCPLDRNNSDFMIHCGLGLLAVALETGADHMARLPSLMALVKDEICRNLFSLMNSERLSIFSASLRCALLLFESLRSHTKFQLETYVTRLTDIVVSENPRTAYEQKEMALDALVQLWKIPGLVTELYLNYDCDPYCSNLFEEVTKLLSKNAFPVQGVYSTHLLSLDALLTVVDSIEHQCHTRIHASELRQKTETNSADLAAAASPAAEPFPGPAFPASGYLIGCSQPRTPPAADVAACHWPSRRPPVDTSLVPTHEELMAVKHKKKLLACGTEHFNAKPAKGIQFLQENGLLTSPLDPKEVVNFIKENPRLDKKMIGEYISNRKNLDVLDAFVKSFDFTGLRVDESLRLYLETFRLPGEAPVISLLMEHFADHWHKSNGEPFANADAAFTLAYAIIMLNVDQHNHNVRKNTVPMTRDDFKRNLKKVNGGADFDQNMLDDIYTAIKSEEIVMPAEQTGLVRENYLWKVLLRRGAGRDGAFIRARSGTFDHDLFSLSWGPTVAALSFVFDRSTDDMIVQKAIGGFRKCAMIAAHYGMSDVYDNLVISLCKFTTLGNSVETPENLVISFGANTKAQLAARTVFNLTHRHGDILRDGWRNLLDCLLQLYRCRLLSTEITEAEDFLSPTGRVSLFREPAAVTQRPETSLLSSLYSYIALGAAESASTRQPTAEDQEHKARAQRVVRECQPEQLVTESKFLRMDSLQELVKALILASHGPDGPAQGSSFDEDSASFFLEVLIKVVIQNRDRGAPLWQSVRNHIYSVVMSASASHHNQLMERGIVGLIRLVIRLVRREELTCQVLQSLRMLLLLRSSCLQLVCRQAAAGLHELLRTAAGSVTSPSDWAVLFTLLECVGAGARPPAVMAGQGEVGGASDADPGTASDGTADSGHASDKCYSDSELYESRGPQQSPPGPGGGRLQGGGAAFHSMSDLTLPRPTGAGSSEPQRAAGTGGWILVGKEGEIEPLQMRALPLNQFNITHDRDLLFHDPVAFTKSAESLSLLIRDAAHVTAANFAPCVQCLRTYVEASLHGREKQQQGGRSTTTSTTGSSTGRRRRVRRRDEGRHQTGAGHSREYDADESDSEVELPAGYHQIAIQLLDLMHTLHTRAAHIFGWFGTPTTPSGTSGGSFERRLDPQHSQQGGGQNEQGQDGEDAVDSLWEAGWCPLLQGIARLCCDSRKQVRASAVTYLQRSLLVHDLQALSPAEWEACFHKVLFPLLAKLLEPSTAAGMEETRMRAATLLCKVFLQHLTPLLSLPTFTALWLTILDFMDKYLQADRADLLHEAIPESMKNMLLVMETAGIFHSAEGYSELWAITWDRIDTFLPSLREQVFTNHPPSEINKSSHASAAPGPAQESSRPAPPAAVPTGTAAGASTGGAPASVTTGAANGASASTAAATGAGAGTGVTGVGGTAGTAETTVASMREIRPASPLHHEELMTSAPSIILGPPLPSPSPTPSAPPSAPAPVSLVSLTSQPPAAGPVFLQPLPPTGSGHSLVGGISKSGAIPGVALAAPVPAANPTPAQVLAGANQSPGLNPVQASALSPGGTATSPESGSTHKGMSYEPGVTGVAPGGTVASPVVIPGLAASVPSLSAIPLSTLSTAPLPSLPTAPLPASSPVPSASLPASASSPNHPLPDSSSLQTPAATDASDVTQQGVTSLEAGGLPVFRMEAAEGSDFLGH